jgi:hypothetical protein
LAATITWLLRTAAGMVGEIVFAFARGSDLDHNCKKWRLFADILNDAAMLVELTAPLWPEWSRQVRAAPPSSPPTCMLTLLSLL